MGRAKRQSGAGRFRQIEQFVRDYTAGLRQEDVKRLFDRDAAQTYAVLARDQADRPEPSGRLRRFFHRARTVFLGLSYKLSPPRRLLFAFALLAGLLGVAGNRFTIAGSGGVHLEADASGFWYLASLLSLVYLLAMELVDRVLVRDELEVARGVQRQLLPAGEVEIPGWSVAHGYRTANEVGGDYYDFLPVAGGRLAVVAGDASGHGMAAGLVMALASAAIHTAIELDPAPPSVARAVNRVVLRTGGARAFMSLFYGLLDPATGELEYLGAGHPFPLLRRASGEIAELGRGGLPLGVRAGLDLATESVRIAPGDLLVLYSDGLPEGLGSDGEAFGFERLRSLARDRGSAAEVHRRILAAFDLRRRAEEALADDLTLVVLERHPA
ncbi:MAG TPA: PP2C family protein-serine/threonine phosphatase [Thermoanaerobaculia bacterium]|nr:PP2C family protein-serine/threonine phosphatase [Thermoanaerobaculia bacterium]